MVRIPDAPAPPSGLPQDDRPATPAKMKTEKTEGGVNDFPRLGSGNLDVHLRQQWLAFAHALQALKPVQKSVGFAALLGDRT